MELRPLINLQYVAHHLLLVDCCVKLASQTECPCCPTTPRTLRNVGRNTVSGTAGISHRARVLYGVSGRGSAFQLEHLVAVTVRQNPSCCAVSVSDAG